MCIKFIILLCLTYYIPTVISFDESEILKWFNEIRKDKKDYVTFSDLKLTYNDYEIDQLENLMDDYAVVVTGENGYSQRRIYYDKFYAAAMNGYIHRYPTQEMISIFLNIMRGTARGYATYKDMVVHYQNQITEYHIYTVMDTYGKWRTDGMHLGFLGFRRAVNAGGIPFW